MESCCDSGEDTDEEDSSSCEDKISSPCCLRAAKEEDAESAVETDSGLESATDFDEDDEEDEDDGMRDHVRRLRRWLEAQADRGRELGQDDAFYHENRQRLWPPGSEPLEDRCGGSATHTHTQRR